MYQLIRMGGQKLFFARFAREFTILYPPLWNSWRRPCPRGIVLYPLQLVDGAGWSAVEHSFAVYSILERIRLHASV